MSDSPNYTAFINKKTAIMRKSPTFAVDAKLKAIQAENEVKRERGEAERPLYNFSIGQPAEPTPEYVRTAVDEMIKKDARWKTMSVYSVVPGLSELKKAIVEKFEDENGITYKPEHVMVTNGGKQAIANAFATTIEEGDKVLMAEPSWVSYTDIVKFHGGVSIGLRTNKEFKFTADTLKATLAENPGAKWLVITSPSNPTGGTYTKAELKDIADVVLAENAGRQKAGKPPLIVMSDDIYEHMVYDDKYLNKPGDKSAIANNIIMAEPAMKPYTVIVNGVAKAIAMTGHRVGYAAGPKELIDAMIKYQSLETSGVSAMEQLAAFAALSRENKTAREAWFDAQKQAYKKRRDLVAELVNIPNSSMTFSPTPGAFYAMIDCTELAKKVGGCHALADKMINEKGVALVPGDDFFVDPERQERTYLRMSYATDEKTIRAGIAAMQELEREILPDAPQRAIARG